MRWHLHIAGDAYAVSYRNPKWLPFGHFE